MQTVDETRQKNRPSVFQPTTEEEGAKLIAEQEYFHEKFGAAYGDLSGYSDLLNQLSEEMGGVRSALYDSGVSFPRVNRYEEKKVEAAQREKELAETEKLADEHPVLSSVASIIASPAQGLDFLGNMMKYAGKSDLGNLDSYEPMYTTDFPVSNFVSTVRGTVSKKIEENTDWEIYGQNVASFLYNTGMSVGDSVTQIAALGPFATYVMGMSAASNGARDVVARGGSNGQAFAAGLASGAAEAVFEKFSIDNLLTPRSVDSVKRLIMETAKQAGVEASEEMFTEIANMLSDAAIMGQNSNFNNAVRGYMADGLSEEEAKQKAYLDNVAQVAWSGAGGALSGGFMGGAVNGMNYAGSRGSGQTVSAPMDVVGQQKTASTGEAGKYRAERPKNIELPTVPIINLSMDEVAQLNGGSLPDSSGYLRKTAIERARIRLGLDQSPAAYIPASNVLRNGEEYVLKITKASLNKMLSPAGGGPISPESIAVLENIERIANNGVYFKSEGDRRGRSQIAGYDHLMTTVYIDNMPYLVDMRVRVYDGLSGGENKLYYFTPEEIVATKKVDTNLPTGKRRALTMSQETVPTFDPTIAPGESGVKAQDMQRGLGVYAPPGESIDSLIERMYNETEPDHRELPELPELISPMEQALIDEEWNGGERMPGDAESVVADILRRAAKSVGAKGKAVGFEQLPEGTRRDFRAGLSKAAAEAREVLRQSYRKTDYIVRQGQKSYYRKLSNTVELGQDAPPSTLAHELFHQLDRGGVISKQFVSALAQDHVALNVVSGGDIKSYLEQQYPTAFVQDTVGTDMLFKEEYRGISDILNGLCGGKVDFGFGHRASYWAKPGALEAEAWAQFGRIQFENSPEVSGMLSALFPNLEKSAMLALKGLI